MNITLLGSCRIAQIKNNNLNQKISYLHSTKEIIQFIKYLQGNINIPSPYSKLCFRSSIMKNKNIKLSNQNKKIFQKSNIFIIEICSKKKYIHNGFFLHHLAVDKRFKRWELVTPKNIIDEVIIETQNFDEIEKDILQIIQLLNGKKLIIVSHYNVKINNEYIKSRNELIEYLDFLCKKHNITFVNPTKVFQDDKQENIVQDDLGHYTEYARNKLAKYIKNII